VILPKDANGNWELDDHISFNDTWATMEQLVAAGKTKAIGVSNFSIKTCAARLYALCSHSTDCL